MVHRPAAWFRNVMILGALIALAMVPAVNALLHGQLPLWLHIPLIMIALLVMGGGAMAAGASYVEYQTRSTRHQ